MLTLIVLSLFKLSCAFALAAPSKYALGAVNATQALNFTSITFAFCGTTACASFLRPPLTDCNITTCACTDTVSNNLATCLQCGFDNSPGMSLSSAQQYLTNFKSACATNGTSVQTETLVINGATAHFGVDFANLVVCHLNKLWVLKLLQEQSKSS
ncbi:hypothetical protein J3R30DRAFT_3414931 [Lentinula aciculospora]|uniref:Extracellular membrane protein CFEM domain-containing protein n=1 Tax=Lentinula aciculospora TaxID=153920 RepID=A0A9W8ZT21_9AGAR|nr:hypothetical protein J3R30DRAFT_3414931 [Lentinula aciculospora]